MALKTVSLWKHNRCDLP